MSYFEETQNGWVSCLIRQRKTGCPHTEGMSGVTALIINRLSKCLINNKCLLMSGHFYKVHSRGIFLCWQSFGWRPSFQSSYTVLQYHSQHCLWNPPVHLFTCSPSPDFLIGSCLSPSIRQRRKFHLHVFRGEHLHRGSERCWRL